MSFLGKLKGLVAGVTSKLKMGGRRRKTVKVVAGRRRKVAKTVKAGRRHRKGGKHTPGHMSMY